MPAIQGTLNFTAPVSYKWEKDIERRRITPAQKALVAPAAQALTATTVNFTMVDPDAVGDGAQSMSSREIAELTMKRHDHVIRDVKVMLEGLYGERVRSTFNRSYRTRYKELPPGSTDALLGQNEHSPDQGDEQIQGVTWTRDYRGYIEAFHLDKSHTMTLVGGYDVQVPPCEVG